MTSMFPTYDTSLAYAEWANDNDPLAEYKTAFHLLFAKNIDNSHIILDIFSHHYSN